jgi:Protein of unknown function (DUF2752)
MMAKPGTARVPFPAWPGVITLAAMALGCAVVLFLFDPSRYPFYPQCLFHRLTGWNCPGCGSLRAMHQLLHGHLLAALRDNLLLILSLPVAAVYSARQFLRWRAGLQVTFPAIRPRGILVFLGVLVIFTIIRNIPSAPFIYLSPP